MREIWLPLLEDLRERREWAVSMGGPDRIERHRAAGKLTARERIEALFDPGTFREIGLLVGSHTLPGEPEAPADALVAGSGLIDGRPALAGVEDFTVMGGSIGSGASDKRYRLCQLAAQERAPLVMMLEGAGHRLTNQHSGRRPNDLQGLAELSGLVPMVCLVLGPSAGHGALTAPLSDFVVMTPQASMFTAGPPLVKAATGEEVTKEELGGPQVHLTESGVAHNLAPDDAAAIDLARRYLGYLPSNAWEAAPVVDGPDTGPRATDEIADLIPPDQRKPYSMRAVLDVLLDRGSVLEIQPDHGRSVVTALARLGGESIAVVANDPGVMAGTVDSAGADKAARFIEVAGAFHLPVLFMADNPGVMAGTAAERQGALRHAARMFAAQHRLDTPKLHVTLRKAFGFGSSIMAMNPFDGQTVSIALPTAMLGAMPAESGSDAAKLDPGERALAVQKQSGPWRSAGTGSYDDVVAPGELRDALLDGLRLARGRRNRRHEPVRHTGILP